MKLALKYFLLLSILAGILWPHPSYAEVSLDKLKAVFIIKFFDYVTWRDAQPHRTLLVLSHEQIASELTAYSQVGKINVVSTSLEDLDSNSSGGIFYLSNQNDETLTKAAIKVKNSGMLIVSNEPDGLSKGSHINFYLEGNKLRFEINLTALQQSHIEVSSQLLKLAKIQRLP